MALETYLEDRVYFAGQPHYYNASTVKVADPEGDRMTFAEMQRQARADYASIMQKTGRLMRPELDRIRRMDPVTLRRYEPVMRWWLTRDDPAPRVSAPPPWTPAHAAYLVQRLKREYRDAVADVRFTIDHAARARAQRSYLRLKQRRLGPIRRVVKGAARWLMKEPWGRPGPIEAWGSQGPIDDRRIAERDRWVLRNRVRRTGVYPVPALHRPKPRPRYDYPLLK